MAVEDHPKFAEWKRALEDLIVAVAAEKEGRATANDVAKARAAYIKIADEI